jgi:hypothetical protein
VLSVWHSIDFLFPGITRLTVCFTSCNTRLTVFWRRDPLYSGRKVYISCNTTVLLEKGGGSLSTVVSVYRYCRRGGVYEIVSTAWSSCIKLLNLWHASWYCFGGVGQPSCIKLLHLWHASWYCFGGVGSARLVLTTFLDMCMILVKIIVMSQAQVVTNSTLHFLYELINKSMFNYIIL